MQRARAPFFFFKVADMSVETAVEAVAETVTDSPSSESGTTENTGRGYSATDPGYLAAADLVDKSLLDKVTASKKGTPSSEELGDASQAESEAGAEDEAETEETAETPAGDVAQADSADSMDDISDDLLERAIAVGYELDDIRSFTDAKAFERELTRVERFVSLQKGNQEQAEQDDPPESKSPDWDKMLEDGHDPDLIDQFKANHQRTAALEAEVRQMRDAERVRIATAESDRFDNAINALGSEFESVLGKGHRSEISKTALENRRKVYSTMSILRDGYTRNGETVSDSELMNLAVHAIFHNQTKDSARKEIKRKLADSGSQSLSRPRSGGANQPSGPSYAVQLEREFWKSQS